MLKIYCKYYMILWISRRLNLFSLSRTDLIISGFDKLNYCWILFFIFTTRHQLEYLCEIPQLNDQKRMGWDNFYLSKYILETLVEAELSRLIITLKISLCQPQFYNEWLKYVNIILMKLLRTPILHPSSKCPIKSQRGHNEAIKIYVCTAFQRREFSCCNA